MSPLVPGRPRERWRDVDRKPAGAWPWLRRLAIAVVAIYLALFAWIGHRVGKAEQAWLAGKYDEAHGIISDAASWHVRAGRVHDALAVIDLARGRLDEARGHLADAARGFFHPPAFGDRKVLDGFLRDGIYEPAQIYAGHRLALGADPAAAFYLGVAENGMNRLDEAQQHLALAGADSEFKARAEKQLAAIAEKRKTGRAPYLLDRGGAWLAATDLRSGRIVQSAPELAALLEGPFGLQLEARDRRNTVRLSLDMEIQRAAEAALGAQKGSLVVLDVATGGLLAAASQPASAPVAGGAAPRAFVSTYEPGSIVKMITLAAALRNGIDVAALFPMECPGWVSVDGVAFRDWMAHKRVESIEHAVAVSCNLAFGQLGLKVGRDGINAELRRFGFDFPSEASGAARPGDIKFDVGALLPEDTSHPNYALGRRAVGLDSIQVTPIGAALMAAGLARGGAPPPVHLVDQKLNILGEAYFNHETLDRDTETLTVEQRTLITRAMQAAVTGTGRAEGTARRAAVAGLSLAMKTGTSGRNPPGYDALVIGFAPAEKPVIAWALIADRAGKAELEAARITGDFLSRIRSRLD